MNIETKFTPGPWIAKDGRISCTGKTGHQEDRMWVGAYFREADGALQAAAPDMYEALELVLKDLKACQGWADEYVEITWETIDEIKAVLNKANPNR